MIVLNLCKQPMDHDEVEDEEACLIKTLVQEHTKWLIEDEIKKYFSKWGEKEMEISITQSKQSNT